MFAEIASTAWHAAGGSLSDIDFSASDSEYVPSDSESDRSLPSENESRDEDEAMEEPKHQPRREQRLREMEYVS